MAEKAVSKRGRPVGTRTSTVELDTLSFKVPVELKARLQAYAKQRRQSISELIREGVEWRIGEGDPLNMRYGTVASGETAYEGNTGNTDISDAGVEVLRDMLSTLLVEVRRYREEVRVSAQRSKVENSTFSVTQDAMPSSDTGNTNSATVDGDIPVASMKAQRVARQTRVSVDVSGRWRARAFTFDPARHQWGELCHKQHDRDGGQSVREQANNECVDCRWERTTAYKERKRAAKREVQPVAG